MKKHDYSPGGRVMAWLYGLAFGLLLFSGFGQMPILKRYYFADIPGLTWSADFYILSDIHYLAAALLLFLVAWRVVVSRGILDRRWSWGPRTWWGVGLFALLIITGTLKALRNLGVFIDPPVFVVVDLTHLGSAIALMLTGLAVLIRGRKSPARQGA